MSAFLHIITDNEFRQIIASIHSQPVNFCHRKTINGCRNLYFSSIRIVAPYHLQCRAIVGIFIVDTINIHQALIVTDCTDIQCVRSCRIFIISVLNSNQEIHTILRECYLIAFYLRNLISSFHSWCQSVRISYRKT